MAIIKRNERLPVRTHRIELLEPIIKTNEASPEFHKKFYESVIADPLISTHLKEKHKKRAMSAAISAGVQKGLNHDQINNEEL